MNTIQSGLLFSLTGAAAVASMTSCTSQKKAEEQKQYNIVYIMTDDHTAQMMSCYDHRYMETPNLDRIAADGVRFTNSFVANSLSGPSRACMITGKHSCTNKFYDNTTCVFDASQQTFPKLCNRPVIRLRWLVNGTWKVCLRVLITGRSCPDKVITIILILSLRTMIRYRSTDM